MQISRLQALRAQGEGGIAYETSSQEASQPVAYPEKQNQSYYEIWRREKYGRSIRGRYEFYRIGGTIDSIGDIQGVMSEEREDRVSCKHIACAVSDSVRWAGRGKDKARSVGAGYSAYYEVEHAEKQSYQGDY